MTAALSDFPPCGGDVPPSGGWTADDLDNLPDDGVRRELLDGVLHVSPSPSIPHQIIAAQLMVALQQHRPSHLLVTQANDVQISPRRMFIPDVLVTTVEAAKHSRGRLAAEDVVLAVEIVSPSSQSMDRVMKPSLYARAGIPFYWLVETERGLTVHSYRLEPDEKIYVPSGTFTDTIEIDEPWKIQIPLAGLQPYDL